MCAVAKIPLETENSSDSQEGHLKNPPSGLSATGCPREGHNPSTAQQLELQMHTASTTIPVCEQ